MRSLFGPLDTNQLQSFATARHRETNDSGVPDRMRSHFSELAAYFCWRRCGQKKKKTTTPSKRLHSTNTTNYSVTRVPSSSRHNGSRLTRPSSSDPKETKFHHACRVAWQRGAVVLWVLSFAALRLLRIQGGDLDQRFFQSERFRKPLMLRQPHHVERLYRGIRAHV